MAVDFPASPTIGQKFVVGIIEYEWDGTKWFVVNELDIDVSDATATATDVLASETFYAGQDPTIKTGTIASKTAETFTPGTTNQTIASGQYLSGTQTILGDADLTVDNIKTGIDIFGVSGTFTADATATASDILSGETAYVNGLEVTGNIASKGAETFTPGTTNQTIASGQYLSGTQTILGDANLIPDNIADGVSIFGVTGNIEVFTPMVATGGTISDVNIGGVNYRYHAFTSTGTSTFNVSNAGTYSAVDVLIVGGGGSGAAGGGGGGGAGGLIYNENINVVNTNYSIVVGAGGLGPTAPRDNDKPGNAGQNSSAFNLTALGGGTSSTVTSDFSGQADGGSGGGASRNSTNYGNATQPNSSSGGFGNRGGFQTSGNLSASGGGGADAVGGTASGGVSGVGGAGLYYGDKFTNNFGENGYFAGGGGGSGWIGNGWNGNGRAGGIGGGGKAGDASSSSSGTAGEHAQPNTGGGGGGAPALAGSMGYPESGNGGSGIVIIRYPLEGVA